jgi:hypothetical protein
VEACSTTHQSAITNGGYRQAIVRRAVVTYNVDMGRNDELIERVLRLGEQLQKLNNNRRMLEEARAKISTPQQSNSEITRERQ